MAATAAASLRCGPRFLLQEAWRPVFAASAHPLFWKLPFAEAGIQAGKWETMLQSCSFSSKGKMKSKSDSSRESGKEKLSKKDAALDVAPGTGSLLKVCSKKEDSTCRAGMGVYNGIKAVFPVAWSSHLYITLVRGLPGTRKLHRRTLKALGLQKCQRTVVKDNTSSIRGMINQVKRLVAVETEEMYKARKQREFELQAFRPPIVVHHPYPVDSPLQLSQHQEGQVQS